MKRKSLFLLLLMMASVLWSQDESFDAFRESGPDTTAYTINPDSAKLVVELDPQNYGFRQRNHRIIMGSDFDFLFRGRGLLKFDYRFFEYLTFGVVAGLDWTGMSLTNKMRQQLEKPSPKQLTILGGVNSKWRLTEWYLHSAVFLEGSFLFGHMWQTLGPQKSIHWRIRPGLFVGIDTVFDSGLNLTLKLGGEAPVDFSENAWKEGLEPLAVVGVSLAI